MVGDNVIDSWSVHRSDDGTIKWFITSQIYNKIAFSLYSSLLSIRYFEMDREKRGIERKSNFFLFLLLIFICDVINYFIVPSVSIMVSGCFKLLVIWCKF